MKTLRKDYQGFVGELVGSPGFKVGNVVTFTVTKHGKTESETFELTESWTPATAKSYLSVMLIQAHRRAYRGQSMIPADDANPPAPASNPIRGGYSERTLRYNIQREIEAGKTPAQASAIAYAAAKRAWRKRHGSKTFPLYLRKPRRSSKKNPAPKATGGDAYIARYKNGVVQRFRSGSDAKALQYVNTFGKAKAGADCRSLKRAPKSKKKVTRRARAAR